MMGWLKMTTLWERAQEIGGRRKNLGQGKGKGKVNRKVS